MKAPTTLEAETRSLSSREEETGRLNPMMMMAMMTMMMMMTMTMMRGTDCLNEPDDDDDDDGVEYDIGGCFASRLASFFPQSIIQFILIVCRKYFATSHQSFHKTKYLCHYICNLVFVIRLVNQA